MHKSSRMLEKPIMLIEEDHQLHMSDTRNAIVNQTSQPHKPTACSQNNPFQYLIRDNSSMDSRNDDISQETKTVKRQRRKKYDRADRGNGGAKTVMGSTQPIPIPSHAQKLPNPPQSTKS